MRKYLILASCLMALCLVAAWKAWAWPPVADNVLSSTFSECQAFVFAGYGGSASYAESDPPTVGPPPQPYTDDFFVYAVVIINDAYAETISDCTSEVILDTYIHEVTSAANVVGTANENIEAYGFPTTLAENQATAVAGPGGRNFASLYVNGSGTMEATSGSILAEATATGAGGSIHVVIGGMDPGVYGAYTNSEEEPITVDMPDTEELLVIAFDGDLVQSTEAGMSVVWAEGTVSAAVTASSAMGKASSGW